MCGFNDEAFTSLKLKMPANMYSFIQQVSWLNGMANNTAAESWKKSVTVDPRYTVVVTSLLCAKRFADCHDIAHGKSR